jgi:hypothetical protein
MKLEDLTLIKTQYVIRDKTTGDLFQGGRMFDQVNHAKASYAQDRWLHRQLKLPNRFDKQDRFEIVKISYNRVVQENTND